MADSQELEPIEVNFGDLFKVSPKWLGQGQNPLRLIVALKGDYIFAVSVKNIKGREVMDAISRGGCGREQIEQIVDHWEFGY